MWQWPAQSIKVYLLGLKRLCRIDDAFADKLRGDFANVEKAQIH
jgi:hypothetical protein